MNFTQQENKELLGLFQMARVYQRQFNQKSLDEDKKHLKIILSKLPKSPSDNLLSLKMHIEKLLDGIEISLRAISDNRYQKLLGSTKKGGNNSVINWVVYELSKLCKTKNGSDWEKIIFILLEHQASKVLLDHFEIKEKIVLKDHPIDQQVKRLKDRKRDWISHCHKLNLSPDILFEEYIVGAKEA